MCIFIFIFFVLRLDPAATAELEFVDAGYDFILVRVLIGVGQMHIVLHYWMSCVSE